MNILAINTAFSESYVALKAEKGEMLKNVDSSLKQSENILGIVDDVLCGAGLNVKSLDAIACVVGPGSFTGIRIGVGLCKGFCMAYNNIKKIEINSLDLLAYQFAPKSTGDFYIVLNALSGNIFVRKYNKNGDALDDAQLRQITDFKTSLDVVGLGEEKLDICNKYEDFSSKELLSFSLYKFSKNEFSNDYSPYYIRKSQAEAQLDSKNGNN